MEKPGNGGKSKVISLRIKACRVSLPKRK